MCSSQFLSHYKIRIALQNKYSLQLGYFEYHTNHSRGNQPLQCCFCQSKMKPADSDSIQFVQYRIPSQYPFFSTSLLKRNLNREMILSLRILLWLNKQFPVPAHNLSHPYCSCAIQLCVTVYTRLRIDWPQGVFISMYIYIF